MPRPTARGPVLLVSAYYAGHGGGIEVVAGELSSRLGLPVRWAASGEPPAPASTVAPLALRAGNAIERATGLPLPLLSPGALVALVRAVRGARAVWVHDLLYPATFTAACAALLLRRPLLVTIHVGEIAYPSPALRAAMRSALRLVTRLVLPRARAVAFVSARVEIEFARRLALPHAVLIANGVDADLFAPSPERDAIRAELGLAGPVVLFVGRFVERKGLALVRALAEARPELTFALAGAGPIEPERWGLANVRIFRGRRGPSLARLYAGADAFVLPSWGEGFPLVVAEALASGLPVLVDPETLAGWPQAAPWVATEPVAGPDAPARWARRLDELLVDRRAAERAAFARAEWDWERGAARYRELLESFAADHAPELIPPPHRR